MIALSVRQPWAWAILHGGKRVENREWVGCPFRGALLLHVGLTCTRREYAEGAEAIAYARADLGLPPLAVPPLAELPRGGLVGAARVVGAAPNPADARGYAIPGALGLALEDPLPLPFVPLRGALGLFPVAWPAGQDAAPYVAALQLLGARGDAACPGRCGARVPRRFVACRQCWLRVPADLRRAVWEAFRGPGPFSAEYLRARRAAVAAMEGA